MTTIEDYTGKSSTAVFACRHLKAWAQGNYLCRTVGREPVLLIISVCLTIWKLLYAV